MLPPVSLPTANPTNPAATAAPGPALEPEEASSGSHGFIVWPPNQISLSASAPRLSFATSTAPASFSRLTGPLDERMASAFTTGGVTPHAQGLRRPSLETTLVRHPNVTASSATIASPSDA